MTRSLVIILKGFGIAGLGFLATSLLILGLSSIFIGKWSQTFFYLLFSSICFGLFYRWLDPYLSHLERRFDDDSSIH